MQIPAFIKDVIDDPRQRGIRLVCMRLVCMVLAEQDDEWQDGRCYFRPESMALIDATPEQDEEVAPALLMAS